MNIGFEEPGTVNSFQVFYFVKLWRKVIAQLELEYIHKINMEGDA